MVDAVKKFVSQASCALFRQSDAVNDTVLLEFDLDNVRIVPLFQLPLDDSHILHVGVRDRTFRRMTAASIPRLVKAERGTAQREERRRPDAENEEHCRNERAGDDGGDRRDNAPCRNEQREGFLLACKKIRRISFQNLVGERRGELHTPVSLKNISRTRAPPKFRVPARRHRGRYNRGCAGRGTSPPWARRSRRIPSGACRLPFPRIRAGGPCLCVPNSRSTP